MLTLICFGCWLQFEWDIQSDSLSLYQDRVLPQQSHLAISQRVRLNMSLWTASDWQFEWAYEQGLLWQEHLLIPDYSGTLRFDDFNPVLEDNQDSAWTHQLDRFLVKKDWGSWRLTLGRQAVGHGNGRFFNPSDIFSPLTPNALNTQYKRGIDGIRVGWNNGDQLELEAFYFFNEHLEDMALIRGAGIIGNLDWSLYTGTSYEEWTTGADLAWTWGESSFYTEGVHRNGKERRDPLRVSMGVQRRFGTRLDAILEFQYHSRGLASFEDLRMLPSMKELLWGELFFLGRKHAALFLNYELTPLLFSGLQWIHDASGDSDWLLLNFSWDLHENGQLMGGYMHPEGPTLSEFGLYSPSFYTEFRWTF